MATETKKRSRLRRCCRRCCPNGCCGYCQPVLQVQRQTDTIIHVKQAVEEKKTPYGYVRFYSGVCTTDNNYTCPMLSVHLYRHEQYHANIAEDNRTVTVDGRNREKSHQGQQHAKKVQEARVEEEVMMIPLEDITRITYKSELKKGIQADIKSHVEPTYKLSENCCDRCCAPVIRCCGRICDRCSREQTKVAPLVENTTVVIDTNENANYNEEDVPLSTVKEGWCTKFGNRFRCWCCRKMILVKLTKKTHSKAEQQAERVITMTIEYSKYNHLDSSSNARLLSNQDQMAYYKDKFAPDTEVKFYLDNNTEIDKKSFEEKREQAETLCRTVMQLKGMRLHYPSEDELDKILDQSHKRVFGLVFDEPVLQLASDGEIRTILGSQQSQLLMVQQQRVTTSE